MSKGNPGKFVRESDGDKTKVQASKLQRERSTKVVAKVIHDSMKSTRS